ncbi:MAG TPA: GNAT family N-acetyltransferase [Xanthobacteraceae bacterium]|nr:GNAT family N-acetyltransferase [Xanthobacteraceae bacterium]
MPSVDIALRRIDAESPGDCAIADIDIFDDIAAAAPDWDHLADGAVATPFARRDWIDLWQRHVGARSGARPMIAVARDARGDPLFLLPLARRERRLFTVAQYFGGRHSQLNMGLWRPDVATAITAADLNGAFATIARRGGVDVFLLLNQPMTWDGRPNPLAQLAHQPSPDNVFSVEFAGMRGEEAVKLRLSSALRGILKGKEKKLAKLAGYHYFRAVTADEAERLLAAFLVQKAAHLKAHGVRNAFAAPGIEDFLRAACVAPLAGREPGKPAIELHAIEGDGEVLAVMGGVASPQRFSCMFNSYTLGEHARWSPGMILIQHMLRHCADRGIASYDLGAGFAQYKHNFCKTTDVLFDSALAFSERGHVAAAICRMGLSGKRWIKSTKPLWAIVRTMRRMTLR